MMPQVWPKIKIYLKKERKEKGKLLTVKEGTEMRMRLF